MPLGGMGSGEERDGEMAFFCLPENAIPELMNNLAPMGYLNMVAAKRNLFPFLFSTRNDGYLSGSECATLRESQKHVAIANITSSRL